MELWLMHKKFLKKVKFGSHARLLKNRVSILILMIFLSLAAILSSSCGLGLERFEDTRDKMGTYVNIVIYAHDSAYQKIIEGSYLKIDELSKIASNYDPESSISILNKNGFIENAPKELLEIINLSKSYNETTFKAFDITVEPVLKLWAGGLWEKSEEIQKQKIGETLALVGSDMIMVDGTSISYEKKGMEATLGGIAKGYIVDRMIDFIKSNGIKNALVNAGGDIATLGSKPTGEKWIVSLENPDNLEEKIVSFAISGEAVATSGNYFRYFDSKKEVHHIIDPRTGYSANLCISATIIAPNATVADILATSVFVLGPVEGMKLVEKLDGVEALIIDNDRNIFRSSGLDKYIIE
jgi:thiamine biosynthesis lipoprotein